MINRRQQTASGWALGGWALAMVATLVLTPATAFAELVVRSIEHGAWPATVAALQGDLQSQGRSVHVLVTDENGRRATCDEYSLSFDAVGAEAFAMGGCDPSTQATEVLLLRRSALFSHGDIVARPLTVGISAVEVRRTSVSGGAASRGGSEVRCTVEVRPFLRDMESGNIVHLVPGRFVLRPLATNVTAAASTDGWNLTSLGGGITVDYEVVDTQRREVVLRDRATLACNVAAIADPGASPTLVVAGSTCSDATPLYTDSPVRGALPAAPSQMRASCGAGAPAAERVFALELAAPQRVRIHLTSDFDGVIYLRDDCGPSGTELACNDDFGDTRHSQIERVLPAGRTYVVVDGFSVNAAGNFELAVTAVAPADPTALLGSTCETAPAIATEGTVHGSTADLADAMHASCGASAMSPERVYRLTLTGRARVRLRLASDFDGVLYVRSTCGAGATELGCNDDDGDTRHSSLDLNLDAGTYFVYVDGYSSSNAGAFDLSVSVHYLRTALRVSAGMTFGASGTSFGGALGVSVVAGLRVPLGGFGLAVGVRYGAESFSNDVASLRVSTTALPVRVDLPLLDDSLSLYAVGELGVAIVHASETGPRASASNTDDEVGISTILGTGLEIHPVHALGIYTEVDYRVASVSGAHHGPLLGNGAVFSAGMSYGF